MKLCSAHQRVGELFGEPGQDGPVRGGEPVAQQAGAGQEVGARLQRDQGDAAARLPAQPLEQDRGSVVLASPASADHHDVERTSRRLDRRRRNRHAVAGGDRPRLRPTGNSPFEQRLPGPDSWRRAMGLDGRGQRHHVETGGRARMRHRASRVESNRRSSSTKRTSRGTGSRDRVYVEKQYTSGEISTEHRPIEVAKWQNVRDGGREGLGHELRRRGELRGDRCG